MPEWERKLWRDAFDVYGPLDWARGDLLTARTNQYQAATSAPLRDFILFQDPADRMQNADNPEDAILTAFGYTGE